MYIPLLAKVKDMKKTVKNHFFDIKNGVNAGLLVNHWYVRAPSISRETSGFVEYKGGNCI